MQLTRTRILGTIVLAGALGATIRAQNPAPTEAAIAAMKVEKVKENLYIVTGGAPGGDTFSGGNTAVFITDSGITLVDTKIPGVGQALLQRIRSVSQKPITRIISTHAHGDHTGNYPVLGAATAETIVHENAKTNMLTTPAFSGDRAKDAPKRTYKDHLTVGAGKDQIDLYYFGRGHTNGDTFVVFKSARTMHVGDMFAWKALPYIDGGAGGSVVDHPKSLARAIATVKDVDTIINGHIPISTWNDLKDYADFTKDFVDYAERSKKAGKSVDQAVADYKVPTRFRGYKAELMPSLPIKNNFQLAYDELK
jgi:cyclase